MNRNLFIVGLSGAIVVALGALGAHGLKPHLSIEQLDSYKTGVSYHMYHTLALLGISLFASPTKASKLIFGLFVGGILLFSGSIYLLSTKELLGIETWAWLGPITPLGGLLFIAGWIILAVKSKDILYKQ